jgi:uncharacterized OsmC-like protein
MNNLQTVNYDNGVNVGALLEAREALHDSPGAAYFKWRAASTWVHGTQTRSRVSEFFGLGEEQQRDKSFTFVTDHPEVFAAGDNGATPVEVLLVALAGCLGAGIAAVAENRGIRLNSVRSVVEGHMDIRGILGMDNEVRNGFEGVRVSYEIDAEADADEIAALVAQSQKRSAVFDIIANPTNVQVKVVKV